MAVVCRQLSWAGNIAPTAHLAELLVATRGVDAEHHTQHLLDLMQPKQASKGSKQQQQLEGKV
jgi:hypothetical protein